MLSLELAWADVFEFPQAARTEQAASETATIAMSRQDLKRIATVGLPFEKLAGAQVSSSSLGTDSIHGRSKIMM
jgi:hypothetical protein